MVPACTGRNLHLILFGFVKVHPQDPEGGLYVRNDSVTAGQWHAICVVPVAGGAPVGDALVTEGDRPVDTAPAKVETMFSISNVGGVRNGPTRPSTFTLSSPYRLTKITTYHWNEGRGAPAGTIALRGPDGKTLGPWPARIVNGVYWEATPNVVLTPGMYQVIDSDPATWAQNSQSGGAGMVWGEGEPLVKTPPPKPTARTERWKVRLDPGPYMSTFELRIDADGNVDGVSHWTCCSGPVNRISGRITPTGDIQLTRHLEAPHTGMSHVWTGRYTSPKAIEGAWSSRSYGHGSGPWRAEVESTDGR